MAMQWQANLFDIAKDFMGKPERIKDFFTFHLLLPHMHKDKQGNIIYEEQNYAVTKNSQKDSGIVFCPDTTFEFYNDGTLPIIVMLTADDTNQTLPVNPIMILPDQLIIIKASDMGAANLLHLHMINQSTTTEGQLTIYILD